MVPAAILRAALEDVVLGFERESAGDIGPPRGWAQSAREEEEEGDELIRSFMSVPPHYMIDAAIQHTVNLCERGGK